MVREGEKKGREVLAGERERAMRLTEGEVWLVLTGCGADRLRSVYSHAASPGIDVV